MDMYIKNIFGLKDGRRASDYIKVFLYSLLLSVTIFIVYLYYSGFFAHIVGGLSWYSSFLIIYFSFSVVAALVLTISSFSLVLAYIFNIATIFLLVFWVRASHVDLELGAAAIGAVIILFSIFAPL